MTTTETHEPLHVQRLRALIPNDPQLQALLPDPTIEEAAGSTTSYAGAMALVLDGYASRPALSVRDHDVVSDVTTGRSSRVLRPEFVSVTYGELHRRVKALASVFRQRDPYRVNPADFVCVIGFAGVDHVVVEMAVAFVQGVTVPMQATLGLAAVEGIFEKTAPVLVASTVADVVFAAQSVVGQATVHTLLVFDVDERVDEDRESVAAAEKVLAENGSTVRLVTLSDLLLDGETLTWTAPDPRPDSLEQMAVLQLSSGTTGMPKGAIQSELMAKRFFRPVPNPLPVVRLVVSPMSHSQGRGSVYLTLARGGTVAMVTPPDLSTLLEDFTLVRPTTFNVFPRALEMVYGRFQAEVARRVADGADKDVARAEVVAEMRDHVMGNRLFIVNAGGAPTRPEVKRFISDDLGIIFSDGLGSTEFGASTRNNRVARPEVIDYRLRDVPELGYYSTDKPYPRGELCVKGRMMISGYYKDPEATAKLFDADGFGLTGDVVEERGPDHLVYIGRRNDVTKLSQGEYVAMGALGLTFEDGSELIHQIYLYGNGARPYLLAVVVPNMDMVVSSLGSESTEADLRTLLRREFQRVGVEAGLKSFEVPRDFIIAAEPFSVENGLLTGIGKVKRGALQVQYGAQLELLYEELDQRQRDDLLALRSNTSTLSVSEKIARALAASLSIDEVDVDSPMNFTQLGGDSLAAPAFAALLEDIFGVELNVNAILSPAGSLRNWTRLVEAALGEGAPAVTFSSVHGKGARQLFANDLDLAAFIDADVLDHAASGPPVTEPRTVLLTGATGFLGRFLCLEWLERLAPVGGKLIVLVRARDEDEARRRLDACFATSPELEQHFKDLAETSLEIMVGDIAEVDLGLNDVQLARLATEVDRIVHPAALVNHVLDYEFLFAPNVAGTAALIALALTHRQKPIDFVSSGAVSPYLDARHGIDEDSALLEEITLTDGYASGYGASKWAGENLLQVASQRFNLPVNVFRGDMMLAHRSYPEQINAEDTFTRLLFSVIETGLAPASFFPPSPDGSRARAHYDGLPVDFVAKAITEIGVTHNSGHTNFNVTNHADDGVSTDVFVDWIIEAGYPIERVADYDEWLTRFESKLSALSEEKRLASSLQVLGSMRERKAHRGVRGSQKFDEALQPLDIGPQTPGLTQDFVLKCLDDMVRIGLIARA